MAIVSVSVHLMDKCALSEKCLSVYKIEDLIMISSTFEEDNSIFTTFCHGFERNLFHHEKNVEFLKANIDISDKIILVNLNKLLDISFFFDSLQNRNHLLLENYVVLDGSFNSIFYVKANLFEIFYLFDSYLAASSSIDLSNLYSLYNTNFILEKICNKGIFAVRLDKDYFLDYDFKILSKILYNFSHVMDLAVELIDLKIFIKHIVFCPVCSTILFKTISSFRPDIRDFEDLHNFSDFYFRDWFISYGFYELGLHYLLGDSKFLGDSMPTLDKNLIRIFSYFNHQVGLSDAALNFSQNLSRSNATLKIEHFPLPAPAPRRRLQDTNIIHSLLTENFSEAQWNFFVIGLDQVNIIDEFSIFQRTDRVIFAAYFFWELLVIPNSFLKSLSKLSLIISPSKFVKQISDRRLKIDSIVLPPTKMHSIKLDPLSQPDSLSLLNLENYYLVIFDFNSDFDRKNIEDTITVFNLFLKQSESQSLLVIKSINSDKNSLALKKMNTLLNSSQKIIHILDNYSRVDMQVLLSKAKCLISLHRAEGFGLSVLDAMSLGIPVISTGFGGTTDFTDGYEIQIPYSLVSTSEDKFNDSNYSRFESNWAQPDLKIVLQYLHKIDSDDDFRSEVSRQGLNLSKLFYEQSKLSYQKFADKLFLPSKFSKFLKWILGI